VRGPERLDHLVAAAELADLARVKKTLGFRVFSDGHDAGFFVETEAGLAQVTVEVCRNWKQDLAEKWEVDEVSGEPKRKPRRPVFDSEMTCGGGSSFLGYGTTRIENAG
jgi:hypothetical protein